MVMFVAVENAVGIGYGVIGIGGLVIGARLPDLIRTSVDRSGFSAEWNPPQSAALASVPALDDDQIDEPAEQIAAHRISAAAYALKGLLHIPVDTLNVCDVRLYLPDDSGQLVPLQHPDEDPDSMASYRPWLIGTGATGAAYEHGGLVFAEGEAIFDTTHGVPPDVADSLREQGLTAVAAMPIVNALNRPIAVVTATTTESRRRFLVDAEDAERALLPIADATARVLIDLLKWGRDDVS